jgi:hypothetical protein
MSRRSRGSMDSSSFLTGQGLIVGVSPMKLGNGNNSPNTSRQTTNLVPITKQNKIPEDPKQILERIKNNKLVMSQIQPSNHSILGTSSEVKLRVKQPHGSQIDPIMNSSPKV